MKLRICANVRLETITGNFAALRWQGFKEQKIVKPQKLNRMNKDESLQVSPAIAKPMLPAVFCARGRQLLVLIPKKRGGGYLKSCFGWHSKNEAAKIFDEEKPNWFVTGDTCDIDGYLSIDLKLNTWDNDFQKGIEETISSLKKCFPYVIKWEDNSILKIFP